MPRKYIKKNERKYSNAKFEQAMNAIKNGLSIRQAAKDFHVPYTTLCTHTAGHVIYERIGRPTKFTDVEESHLAQSVLALQVKPVSINEFLNLAKQYASALNKDNLFPSDMPTYDWLRSFLSRHSNLVLKNSTPIDKSRAKVTASQVNEWFNLLTKVINDNDLANRPGQIYNADETGFSDTTGSSKVLVHRGTSNAYKIEGGTGGKSFTSVLICASATGHILAPFVVYRSKRLFQEWCMGGPLNTGFSNSDSGWMENKIFYEWFQEMFLEATKHLPRPVLLILDGHKSHFTIETLELAVKNEVIILCLPPHATHVLQPLDCVFFNPVKVQWKTILKNEYQRTRNKTVGKSRFPALLSQLWKTDAITEKTNILKSFMKTGIFPLNPASIDWSKILQDTTTCVNVNISSPTVTATCFNNEMNNSNDISASDVSTASNNNHTDVTNPSINVSNTTVTAISSFDSSIQAISVLDQVLNETILSHDDEDEDYLPNRSTGTSIDTVTLSSNQQSCLQQSSTSQGQQPIKSRRSYRKRKTRPKIIGIDSLDEEDDTAANISSAESLKAITDTLQAVFAPTPDQLQTKPTKRTLVRQSSGQVMTQQKVIEQLAKQRQKNSKKSCTTSRTSMSRKSHKVNSNAEFQSLIKLVLIFSDSSSIDPAITSSISIGSSNVETSRYPVSYSSLPLPPNFQNVTTPPLFSYPSSAAQTTISSNLPSAIGYMQPYYNQ
ncbi:unnamed protein product, partial [Rotaria sp. Silwood2]